MTDIDRPPIDATDEEYAGYIENLNNPTHILNQLHPRNKLYALISGGKDSITAATITNRIMPLTGVIFIDTTIGLSSTQDFVKNLCHTNNWPLTILRPKVTYEDMVLKYGFPGPSHHRMAFIYLKWQPIYYWIKNHPDKDKIALISGVRKKESNRRGRTTQAIRIDPTCRDMVWVAPIIDISDAEVWSFVRRENIAVSPSYATLHISGDCLCGAYSARGEAELINQFYPEVAEKIRDLERRCQVKYCTWGNQSSMQGVQKQTKLEGWLCADCNI